MADADTEFRDLLLMENPAFEDVMRCVFGIQGHEIETYVALLDHPESSAAALADVLGRDRTNVNRSLSALRAKELVERRRELLDDGGHVYCYVAEPLPAVKERLHAELDAWTAAVHDRIDGFGGTNVDSSA